MVILKGRLRSFSHHLEGGKRDAPSGGYEGAKGRGARREEEGEENGTPTAGASTGYQDQGITPLDLTSLGEEVSIFLAQVQGRG